MQSSSLPFSVTPPLPFPQYGSIGKEDENTDPNVKPLAKRPKPDFAVESPFKKAKISSSLPKPELMQPIGCFGRKIELMHHDEVLSPLGRKGAGPAANNIDELWPRSFIEIQRREDKRAFATCPAKWRDLFAIYLFVIVKKTENTVKKGYIGRSTGLANRLSWHVSLINKEDSTTALAKAWRKGRRIFFGVIYACKRDDRLCFEKMAQNETALIEYHLVAGSPLANRNSGNGQGAFFGSPLANGTGGFLSAQIQHVLQMNSQLQVLPTEEPLSPSKNAYGWKKIVVDKKTGLWGPKGGDFPTEWGLIHNGIYLAKTLDEHNEPTYYIGKTTKTLLKRINQHTKKMTAGELSLYESARRSGSVYFGILGVTCSQKGLQEHERRLIRYYSSIGRLHNIQKGSLLKEPVSPLRQVPSPNMIKSLQHSKTAKRLFSS